VQLGAVEHLLAGVVRPWRGEDRGEQPDLVGFGDQAPGQGVAGMVALVPVAVPVGDLSPVHRLVVAGPYLGQQGRVQVIGVVGFGLLDCGVGLAQHLLHVSGPPLVVWVHQLLPVTLAELP